MSDISLLIIMLIVLTLIIKILKRTYIAYTLRVHTRYLDILKQINTLVPDAKIVKILKSDNNLEILCTDARGFWFKVDEKSKKNIQLSAININEVVTELTKIK